MDASITADAVVDDVRDKEFEAAKAKAEKENATRSGKGSRLFVGKTRGKGSQIISYEAFNKSEPDTLPGSIAEFAELTKISDEKEVVSLLIDGFNANSYREASDPIAEYVNPVWPDDVKLNFRTVVRTYSKGAQVSIEDAVSILKPGIEAAYQKSLKS